MLIRRRDGGVQVRAPAKINLCLYLGPLREDGLHELTSIFEPLDLYDTLTVTESDRDRVKDEKLHQVGWTVVRVRIGGLEAVDHAHCVVSKSLTNDAIAQKVHPMSHPSAIFT